jgi:hypothetical protein
MGLGQVCVVATGAPQGISYTKNKFISEEQSQSTTASCNVHTATNSQGELNLQWE